MITGIHAMLYSKDADATRAFLRDALQLASVDAGGGWLIFALPPAELGVHPAEQSAPPELYLMCDNVDDTVATLTAAGARVADPIVDQGWGRVATIAIPGDVRLGIYEPRHPTAIEMSR